MKKLILMLFLINITAGFSQWEKIESPKGNMILRGIIMQNDTLFSIAHGNRMVYMDKNKQWYEFDSNLNEIFAHHKQSEWIITHDIISIDDDFFILTTNGLFASFNKGKTWEHIPGLEYKTIYSLIKFNNKYYAICDGLYESENLLEWKKSEIEGGNKFTQITYSDSTLYGVNNGIFVKSDNYGISYDSLFNLNSNFNLLGISPNGKIIADKNKIAIIEQYAILLISKDFGKTWERQGIDAYPLYITMIGDTTLIAFESGIYYSHDNLTTWKKYDGINFKGNKGIIINNEYSYYLTYYGLYQSTDYGISWKKNDMNLKEIPVYHIGYNEESIYASVYYNYIEKSPKNEYDWINLWDSNKEIASSAQKTYIYDNMLFSIGGAVNISYDGGNSWQLFYPFKTYEIFGFKDMIFIYDIGLNSYYTKDFGKSWISINDNDDEPLSLEKYINHNDTLYATNPQDSSIYIYNESKNEWSLLDYIGVEKVKDIISYKNDFIFTSSEKVYKYNLKTGLLKEIYEFESTIVDIVNYGPNFFVITADQELMLSKDTCNSWFEIHDGIEELFPYFSILDISIIDNSIYAATHKGIYKANLDDFNLTSVDEIENQNYLYTYPPYPQPASTEVRSLVYWDTSLEMNTESVKIYNTNGVEVSREQDISFEQINAYSGNLIWHCTNVPDGVYLIQISHGDREQTIKVMVKK